MKMTLRRGPASSRADAKLLINSVTLITLGLSILFLNSWDNLFVRTTVALFWLTYLLILNGPSAIRALGDFRSEHDRKFRRRHKLSVE